METQHCKEMFPIEGTFEYKGISFGQSTTIDIIKRAETFTFRDDDLVVATYPRSGTTLTQELIWHVKNKHSIQKDVKYGNITFRFPFLEFNSKFRFKDAPLPIDVLENKPEDSARLIKTHLPMKFFNLSNGTNSLYHPVTNKKKFIIVARNVRDVAVSLFNFYKNMPTFNEWKGSWELFADLFVQGEVTSGTWLDFNLEWWNASKSDPHGNFLFLKFEDIVTNMKQEVSKIAKFLNEELTEEQMDVILHNCSFACMSKPDEQNAIGHLASKFFRKGQVGDWQNYFTPELVNTFEKIEEKAKKEGLEFVLT